MATRLLLRQRTLPYGGRGVYISIVIHILSSTGQTVSLYHNLWCVVVIGLVWFGLVSLFNGISTLFRLFNAKAILQEEQQWYYLTHSWEDKGVHTFPKGICPKVNVIARLEYELAYYDSAVHRFNHYTTRTGLISASPESQPSSSDAKTQLTDFSQIPKILRARFRYMTSFTPPVTLLSGIFILTSLNDTSSPHAREHLRSCCT